MSDSVYQLPLPQNSKGEGQIDTNGTVLILGANGSGASQGVLSELLRDKERIATEITVKTLETSFKQFDTKI